MRNQMIQISLGSDDSDLANIVKKEDLSCQVDFESITDQDFDRVIETQNSQREITNNSLIVLNDCLSQDNLTEDKISLTQPSSPVGKKYLNPLNFNRGSIEAI